MEILRIFVVALAIAAAAAVVGLTLDKIVAAMTRRWRSWSGSGSRAS